MLYIESKSHDPAYNLALEQYIFDTFPDDCFMLWQNADAVIVGLHQNTAEEVNKSYLEQNGILLRSHSADNCVRKDIPVVRRLSGGGAVFHDLGNINYTIIRRVTDDSELDFAVSARPITDALSSLGIKAVAGGRNDITVDGKKFSGCARYLRGGRLMHHGTILFDTNFTKMAKALRPPEDKFVSKGIKSVRARVVNLREYLPDMTTPEFFAFLRTFIKRNHCADEYFLTGADFAAVERIRAERYSQWDWNWGQSPAYNVEKRRRLDGVGVITVRMRVDSGVIEDITVSGDYFGNRPFAELSDILAGTTLDRAALLEKLTSVVFTDYFESLSGNDFIRILLD